MSPTATISVVAGAGAAVVAVAVVAPLRRALLVRRRRLAVFVAVTRREHTHGSHIARARARGAAATRARGTLGRTRAVTSEQIVIRDGRDEDAAGLIELIGAVFAEYPGCVLDVDGELPELRAIATAFRGWGGRFWVAETAGAVIGCVGCTPSTAQGGLELRKLYVAARARNHGLGSRLCDLVEDAARARGAAFVDLWSDTRFVTAHRLYARRGYVRGPASRELHDQSATVEYYFRKDLAPAGSGA